MSANSALRLITRCRFSPDPSYPKGPNSEVCFLTISAYMETYRYIMGLLYMNLFCSVTIFLCFVLPSSATILFCFAQRQFCFAQRLFYFVLPIAYFTLFCPMFILLCPVNSLLCYLKSYYFTLRF